jgi:hypothetical protein
MCSNCPVLEKRIRELEGAIREHRESRDMSRLFAADAVADTRLWAVIE